MFRELFRTTRPSWTHDAKGTIWRLLCEGSVLVGDVRDTESKTASFFALDVASGAVRWRDVTVDGGWWVGMQTIARDTLVVHGYEKPDMPIAKGITAIDLATGKVLWSDSERTLHFMSNGKAYAQRASFRTRSFEELDLRTGATITEYGSDEDALARLRTVAAAPAIDPTMLFSEPLEAHDESVRAVVTGAIDLSRSRGGVEVLRAPAAIIVSHHEPARGADAMLNNEVQNILHVLSPDGAVVYKDTIVARAPGIVPDAFFVKDAMLLYVREGSEVVGVRLKIEN